METKEKIKILELVDRALMNMIEIYNDELKDAYFCEYYRSLVYINVSIINNIDSYNLHDLIIAECFQ